MISRDSLSRLAASHIDMHTQRCQRYFTILNRYRLTDAHLSFGALYSAVVNESHLQLVNVSESSSAACGADLELP